MIVAIALLFVDVGIVPNGRLQIATKSQTNCDKLNELWKPLKYHCLDHLKQRWANGR